MKILSVLETSTNFISIKPFCNAISAYNSALDLKYEVKEKKLNPISNVQNHKIEHILMPIGHNTAIEFSESKHQINIIPIIDIKSSNIAEYIKQAIIIFEKYLLDNRPDWIVLFGDGITSMAFSLAAKKSNVQVCLIEAGLSYSKQTIIEKLNLLLTNHLSDLLLTFDDLSHNNLLKDGIAESRIRLVGNIRFGTHESNRKIASTYILESILRENLETDCSIPNSIPVDGSYDVMSIQLPMNVEKLEVFDPLINFLLTQVNKKKPLIWLIHPNVRKQLIVSGLWNKVITNDGIILLKPVDNFEMLRLNIGARIMMVDSIDFQEECYLLGTPCIMMRWITEYPNTLRENGGTTILVGNDMERIKTEYHYATSNAKNPNYPKLWVDDAAEKCLKAILET